MTREDGNESIRRKYLTGNWDNPRGFDQGRSSSLIIRPSTLSLISKAFPLFFVI